MNIDWQTSEWDPKVLAAIVEPGLDCSIEPTDDGFFWIVRLTSSVSEWPEVWDCKPAATLADAKAAVLALCERVAPTLTKRPKD